MTSMSRWQYAVCITVATILSSEFAEGRGILPPESDSIGHCSERLSPHGGVREKRYITPSTSFTGRPSPPAPAHVELVLVADHSLYRHHRANLTSLLTYCRDVADRVRHLYAPLNMAVSLVEVVVWGAGDEAAVSADVHDTLRQFAKYKKRLREAVPHDTAHLLTKRVFSSGVVGLGYVDAVCSREFSCGVVSASDDAAVAGAAVAHELGHNLGMADDGDRPACRASCPPTGCIMDSARSDVWSHCSRAVIAKYFDDGREHCLRNQPTRQFQLHQHRERNLRPRAMSPTSSPSSPPPARTPIARSDVSAAAAAAGAGYAARGGTVVKVQLLVDQGTLKHLLDAGRNVRQHFMEMIGLVNSYYKQLEVTAQLAGVTELSASLERSVVDANSIDDTLGNLGDYARDTAAPSHHVVILMTRHRYPKFGQADLRAVTGKAYTNGVCSLGYNVAVVSTKQPDEVVPKTLAHELGHLLGMRHDDFAGDAPGCPEVSDKYIMAAVIGQDTQQRLSRCSVNTWRAFFKSGRASCLTERSVQSVRPSSSSLHVKVGAAPMPRGVRVRVHVVLAESTLRARGGAEYCRKLMRDVHSMYLPLGIEMELAGVSYLRADEERRAVRPDSAQQTLDGFTDYAAELRRRLAADYHLTVLLAHTSYPHIRDGKRTEFRVMGLARPGEVCRETDAVAIVSTAHESDARTASTLAHELGHLVGLNDDNRASDAPACPDRSRTRHIMSADGTDEASPQWSQCSINTWKLFYASQEASCLRSQTKFNDGLRKARYNNMLQSHEQRVHALQRDPTTSRRRGGRVSQNHHNQA